MESIIDTSQDAHWSCSQCGDCCRLYTLGPVEPEIVQNLEAQDIETLWPAAASGWVETRAGPEGPSHFLTHRDGACVFLEPNNQCAVHRLLGADAKPGFCRTFPFDRVRHPTGETLTIRPECTGYGDTFETGTPLSQAASLLGPSDIPSVRSWAPESVALGFGMGIDTSTWAAAEEALRARLRSAPAHLHPVCVVRDGLLDALPSTTKETWMKAIANAPPGPAIARDIFRGLLQALGGQISNAPDGARKAFLRQMQGRLEQLLVATDSAPLEPETRRFLGVLVEDALLAKRLTAYGSVLAGLGALLLAFQAADLGDQEARDVGSFHRRLAAWTRFAANPAIFDMLRMNHRALEALTLTTAKAST